MAVGFTPKHIEEVSLDKLTKPQFLALAYEAATEANWKVNYISENGLIAYTDSGIFAWNAEIQIKIENRVATIQSKSLGGEMIDWGKNKKNIVKFIASFEELKSILTKEALDTKYQELRGRLVSQEEDLLMLPPATTTEQVNDFFYIFKPTKDFFITPILLDLNILIFILMAISGVNIMSPDSESLLNWGANFRPMTLDGEWWRLITSSFLHIGIFHLLMNLYALLNIGILLEPHLGRTRFASAYMLTGIAASVTSLWWYELTISAGASGAIFGMYGLFLAMLTTNLIEKTARKELLASIIFFVGYNILNGLSRGGVDNAAHIGGLVSGLIIGYAFIPSLKKPTEDTLKFGTVGLMTSLILASSFVIFKKIPNDIVVYEAKIKQFSLIESKALAVYHLPKEASTDKILHTIKDTGIYYWNENIKLINSLNELNLSLDVKARNKILKEYCELYIKNYELIYKGVSENSNSYESQIEDCRIRIEMKLKELNNDKEAQ